MAKIDEIKQQAAAVKNATQVGENTAMRVGGALYGLADIAKQQDVELGKKANTSDVNTKFTEEKNRVDGELGKKFDKESVAQESGDAEDKVMSQKATTTAIADETTRAKAAEEAIIFDVSAHNNGAVFESLQALLSSSNLSTIIPTSVRRGGITIRFIQGSISNPNNKYAQYRLTNQSWSIDVDDWQEIGSAKFLTGEKVGEISIDDEPIAGSENLVKSGGVQNDIINHLATQLLRTSIPLNWKVGFYKQDGTVDINGGNSYKYIEASILANYKYIFTNCAVQGSNCYYHFVGSNNNVISSGKIDYTPSIGYSQIPIPTGAVKLRMSNNFGYCPNPFIIGIDGYINQIESKYIGNIYWLSNYELSSDNIFPIFTYSNIKTTCFDILPNSNYIITNCVGTYMFINNERQIITTDKTDIAQLHPIEIPQGSTKLLICNEFYAFTNPIIIGVDYSANKMTIDAINKSQITPAWQTGKYYFEDGSLKNSDNRLSAVRLNIDSDVTEIISNVVSSESNYGGNIVFFDSSDKVLGSIVTYKAEIWKIMVPVGTTSIGFTNATLNVQPNPFIIGVSGLSVKDVMSNIQTDIQTLETSIENKIDGAWLNGGHIEKEYTKDDCIYNDGVIASNGGIYTGGNGNWRHSDYIPIEYSNGTFILTDNLVSGTGWGMAFYDKNRKFCGYQGFNKDENLSVAIPTNAKYFRFSHNDPTSSIINISVSYDVVFNDSLHGQLRRLDTDEISVYGLGDSTNSDDAQRGVGTPYDNAHFSATKVIAKRLNASIYVNYSVPGTDTAYAYKQSQLIPDTATIVVIVVGINDLNHGDTIGDIDTILAIENVDEIPEDTILGIYVKMVKKLRARLAKNAQIVCVSPYFYSSTTIRADLITLREGIRKMCWSIGQRKGMRFIDGCDVGINPSNYGMLCRDTTHPMMEGQTVIASHIMEHITPPSIAAEQYDLPEVLDNGLKMVVTPYIPLVS